MWDMLVGRGDTRERLWLLMSPRESLCSSDSAPVTRYPKATQCCCEPQPYLPGLGLPGPHKVDMVCTHDHYHHQKTRNQGLGATENLPQTSSRPQHFKSWELLALQHSQSGSPAKSQHREGSSSGHVLCLPPRGRVLWECTRGLQRSPFSRSRLTWLSGSLTRVHSLQF